MYLLFAAALPGPEPDPSSPPGEPEVQRLVESAREGDQVAARRLYQLHVNRVYRAVRPMCPSNDEAEEVVQEAFIKAFAALGRYRPSPKARFLSWLLTIAMNTARSRARRRRRSQPTDDDVIERLKERRGEVEPPRQEERLVASAGEDREAALLAVLGDLDEGSRKILSLRYGAGLTAAEVGRVCGMREATVRKTCQRLRERLLRKVRDRLVEADSSQPPPSQAANGARAERSGP